MKTPTPPSGTGFVIVSVAAVLAALGVIQVEVQGLTEHTRQLTGIRTSGTTPAGGARAALDAERQALPNRSVPAQGNSSSALLPVGNLSLAR